MESESYSLLGWQKGILSGKPQGYAERDRAAQFHNRNHGHSSRSDEFAQIGTEELRQNVYPFFLRSQRFLKNTAALKPKNPMMIPIMTPATIGRTHFVYLVQGSVAGMSNKETVVEMTRKIINICESDELLRLKATAFTRHRSLGANNLLYILLHRLVGSLQLAIDVFYDFEQARAVSKQAFSKVRANLNPEFVRKSADGIAEINARDNSVPTYQGMRLIAIDGTDIALENSQELRETFGCSGPNKDAATALGSLAYGRWIRPFMTAKLLPMPPMSGIWRRNTWRGCLSWTWAAACCCLIAGIPQRSSLSTRWTRFFLRHAGAGEVESAGGRSKNAGLGRSYP